MVSETYIIKHKNLKSKIIESWDKLLFLFIGFICILCILVLGLYLLFFENDHRYRIIKYGALFAGFNGIYWIYKFIKKFFVEMEKATFFKDRFVVRKLDQEVVPYEKIKSYKFKNDKLVVKAIVFNSILQTDFSTKYVIKNLSSTDIGKIKSILNSK